MIQFVIIILKCISKFEKKVSSRGLIDLEVNFKARLFYRWYCILSLTWQRMIL